MKKGDRIMTLWMVRGDKYGKYHDIPIEKDLHIMPLRFLA